MTKLITLFFILIASTSFAQTYQATPINPSGADLGGAGLGGPNSTAAPTNIPSNTLPRSNEFGNSIQNDQAIMQQQQQERLDNMTTPTGTTTGGLAAPGPAPTLPHTTIPNPQTTTPTYDLVRPGGTSVAP